jgi:hypothetical protein
MWSRGLFGTGSNLVAFVVLLAALTVLNVTVLLTGSRVALDALLLLVGFLLGLGVSEIVTRLLNKRLAAVVLGVGAAASGAVYLVLTGDGMEMAEPARLLFGLALGLIGGVRESFRVEPTPEEMERRREAMRRSRPAVLVVGGIAVLLTAAAFADALLRGA